MKLEPTPKAELLREMSQGSRIFPDFPARSIATGGHGERTDCKSVRTISPTIIAT